MIHQELSSQECPVAWVFIYSRGIQVDNQNQPSYYYNVFVEMKKEYDSQWYVCNYIDTYVCLFIDICTEKKT